MAAPLPAKEGDRDAQASPTQSSSRGLAEPAGASSAPMAQVTPEVPLPAAATTAVGAQQAPPQDAVVALPPSPPTPPTAVSPTPPAVLDRAAAELDRLRQDLLGADPRLVVGRLELASGWIRSELRFGRRWSRPRRLAMRRGRPSLRRRLLVTQPWGRWLTSVVAARRWRTSCKACGISSRKRPAFAKSRKKA